MFGKTYTVIVQFHLENRKFGISNICGFCFVVFICFTWIWILPKKKKKRRRKKEVRNVVVALTWIYRHFYVKLFWLRVYIAIGWYRIYCKIECMCCLFVCVFTFSYSYCVFIICFFLLQSNLLCHLLSRSFVFALSIDYLRKYLPIYSVPIVDMFLWLLLLLLDESSVFK